MTPFNANSISGLVAWYDGGNQGNSNGQAVTNFTDSGSNYYHAASTQPFGNDPYWTNNGSVLNGKGAVRFFAGQQCLTNFVTSYAPTNWVFFVGNWPVNSGGYIFDGNASRELAAALTGTTTATMYAGSQFDAGTVDNTPMLYEFVFTGGANSYIATNGVKVGSGNPGGNNLQNISLGSRFNGTTGNGDLSMWDLIIYNRAPTPAERTTITNFCGTNFGLVLH